MFKKLFKRRIREVGFLFNGHYIDVRAYYVQENNIMPSIGFISEVDTSKVFAFIRETMDEDILAVYQHSYFEYSDSKLLFNNTVFVLKNKRLIELGTNYCQVLHPVGQTNWMAGLIADLAQYRIVAKEPAIGFARSSNMN